MSQEATETSQTHSPDMESIVSVLSDSESDNSVSFVEPPRQKRARTDDKTKSKSLFLIENQLLDRVNDIECSIAKMVPIQEEIMKCAQNMSERMNDLAQLLLNKQNQATSSQKTEEKTGKTTEEEGTSPENASTVKKFISKNQNKPEQKKVARKLPNRKSK